MATYNSADLNSKPLFTGDDGNSNTYYGTSVATGTNIATGDKIRVCKVPAGFVANEAIVVNTTFGTTVPAALQFEPLDGSASVDFVAAGGVTLQTASANGSMFARAPVAVAKDSYVTLTVGTVSAGNGTGVVTVIVNGEYFGAE